MNRILIALFAAAALAGVSNLVLAGGDHKPMKGGIVTPGKAADFELVAKPTVLQLYVQDHGKLRDVSKASAKLTLLAGKEKQEVELKPAGDKLEATGTFNVTPGTKVIAVVTDGGKPLGTARFALK